MLIKKYRIIFLLSFFSYLDASQYGPNMLFQKPYDTQDYMGNFTGTFCVGKTDQSYNESGQIVPFLKNYGKQDFFLDFIDPTAGRDLINKIGTIDFSGEIAFQSMNLSYYKNIMHHMFLGLGTIVQNLNVHISKSNIELMTTLTPDQLQRLEVFEAKIPENLNTSGILSTYLESGYNRKFTNLQSMDSLQLYLKGAIITPQWAQGGQLNLLQYPFTGNTTFGYQVMTIISMHLTHHMTFGIFSTINSFQSKMVEVPHDENIVNNHLIINKKTLARYTPGTVYNGAVYLEFDEFSHPISVTAGLSFMYGTGRKLKEMNPATYNVISSSEVNIYTNATLQAWNVTALFLELDYNFLTQENPEGPCLTVFFNTPLAGYHYPKIHAIGGEFGLNFNYRF